MTPRKGLFVVIESLDGVGKTTLVSALAATLGGMATNTPGSALRPMTAGVLNALGDNQIARCTFYAATVLAEGLRARMLADEGRIVVMDRYWLSTIAYARARGVTADLSGLEALVPRPDVTLLLTLEESERVRRIRGRGDATIADRETFDPRFREAVLREMRRGDRDAGLRPLEIDVTGCDRAEAVERVTGVLAPWLSVRAAAGHEP